jgi:hypothetical protein
LRTAVVERAWDHAAVTDDLLTRLRATGFVGAIALAIGATGSGVLPTPNPVRSVPVLGLLASKPYGVAVSVAIAAAGMVLLVTAWWRAGRLPGGPPPVRWTAITATLWALPLVCAPPMFSRDVYSYAAQGDVYAHGLDPYVAGPAALPSQWLESVSVTWWDTPAPYGPLFLLLARIAAVASGGHVVIAVLLLRLVALAGIVLVAVYLPELARRCGVDERAAAWLGLGSPLLLAHFASGAHNDALMVGLLVAGLAYGARRQGIPAAALIALAAAVKVPAVVALPFVAVLWAPALPGPLRGRAPVWRAAVAATVVAGVVFGVVTAMSGLGLGWVGTLDTASGTIQWTSLPTGLGLAVGWVMKTLGLGSRGPALDAFRSLAKVAMAVILVVIWWRVRNGTQDVRAVVAAAGWALVTVVVLAPAFHPWYALWALVPLAAAVIEERVRRGLAVATVALSFLVFPDGYSLARPTEVPGVLLDVVVAVVAAVLGGRAAARWWRERLETPSPPPTRVEA